MLQLKMTAMTMLFALGIGISQPNLLDQFIEKYTNQDHITTLDLSGWSLDVTVKQTEHSGTKQVLQKINRLKVVIGGEGHSVQKNDIDKLLRQANNQAYELLTTVKHKGQQVQVYSKTTQYITTHVLMIVEGEKRILILDLEGQLTPQDLEEFHLNLEGVKFEISLSKSKKRQA